MPLMQNLPRMTDTYSHVCGVENPWANITGIEDYGANANQYHTYMQCFYDDLPVMNNFYRLKLQIISTFYENAPKYTAMYAAQQSAAGIAPTSEMSYTDTMARTGHDDLTKTGTETDTRTGSISDGGTDSTTDTSTITDSTVTYDNATLRDTAKSTHGGGVSVTHGKTTTYNNVADARTYAARKDETQYSSTFTRTITGHKTSPAEIMQQYTDFVKQNSVFAEIIRDVVKAISCIVYIPVVPEQTEEE